MKSKRFADEKNDAQVVSKSLIQAEYCCGADCLCDFLMKMFCCVVVTKSHLDAMQKHQKISPSARLTGFKNFLICQAKCHLGLVFFLLLLSLTSLGYKNVSDNMVYIIENRTECRVNLTVYKINGFPSSLDDSLIARLPVKDCVWIQEQIQNSGQISLIKDEYLVAEYVDCFKLEEKVTTASNCFRLFRCLGNSCHIDFWTSSRQ